MTKLTNNFFVFVQVKMIYIDNSNLLYYYYYA